MFRFTFDFTEQDALHFTLFCILNAPLFKWANRVALALLLTIPLLPILFFLQDLLSDAPWEFDELLIRTVLTTVLCIVLYRIYTHFSERTATRDVLRRLEAMRAAHMFGIRIVIFEEMHIVERSEHTERTIAYRSITDVSLSDKGIYLFTAPTEAIVLPLYIFASEEEKRQILALVRAKVSP